MLNYGVYMLGAIVESSDEGQSIQMEWKDSHDMFTVKSSWKVICAISYKK